MLPQQREPEQQYAVTIRVMEMASQAMHTLAGFLAKVN